MNSVVSTKPAFAVTAIVVALSVISMATPAFAQNSISLVSGAGVVLPAPGAYVADPNVQISRDGGLTWLSAYASDQDWGPGPYPGSHLVGPYPQTGGNPESYRFRTTFTLPKGITNPTLVGNVIGDDQTGAVIVNGVTILSHPTGWDYYPEGSGFFDFSTSDNTLFTCGVNTLEFDITNLGGVGGVGFSALVSYEGGTAEPCNGTPAQQIATLVTAVQALAGDVSATQLQSAQKSLDAGRKSAALGSLNAFANHVKAQAGKKKITAAEADQILAAVNQITIAIGQ